MRLLPNLSIKKRIKVGVSYASDDKKKSWRLGKAFKKAGIEYYDYSKDPEVTSAEDLQVALYEVYNTCDFIVALFSPHYFQTGRLALETEFKVITDRLESHDHDFLIPVVIDETDFKSKHTLLEPFQYTTWSDINPGGTMNKIIGATLSKARRYKIGKSIGRQRFELVLRFVFIALISFGTYQGVKGLISPSQLPESNDNSSSELLSERDTGKNDSVSLRNGQSTPVVDSSKRVVKMFENLCSKNWEELKATYDSIITLNHAKAFVTTLNGCLAHEDYEISTSIFFAITSEPGQEAVRICRNDNKGDAPGIKRCLIDQAKLGIEFSRADHTYDFTDVSSEVTRRLVRDGLIKRVDSLTAKYIMPSAEPYGKFKEPYFTSDDVPVYVIIFKQDKL